MAYHTKGNFEKVDIEDINDELRTWEQNKEATLLRLAAILHQLLDVAKNQKASKLRGHRKGYGWLGISRLEPDTNAMLPNDLRALWQKETKAVDDGDCRGTDGEDDDTLNEDKKEVDDLEAIVLNR